MIKKQVSFRIEENLMNKLKQEAKEQCRTINNQLEYILNKYFQNVQEQDWVAFDVYKQLYYRNISSKKLLKVLLGSSVERKLINGIYYFKK